MPHGHLLRCGFAVDINQACLHRPAHRILPHHRVQRRKRIVKGTLHKHLAQRLRDQNLATIGGRKDPRTHTGCSLGKIQRADDPRLGGGKRQHVFLIKRMVPQRQRICAGIQQDLGVRARQPHAAGGVFAIDHDKIQPPVFAQTRQMVHHRLTARAAHHIT